jgi:hypothetical protein
MRQYQRIRTPGQYCAESVSSGSCLECLDIDMLSRVEAVLARWGGGSMC